MRGDATEGARDFLAMALASVASAALLYLALERAAYREILSPEFDALTSDEALLVPWILCGKTLLLCGLPLALGTVTALVHSRRLAYGVFGAGASLALSFVALDLQVFTAFGRHLSDVLRFAALPEGAQAAGGTGQWAWLVLRWLVLVSGATALLLAGAHVATQALTTRLSRPFSIALGWLVGVALLGGSIAPHTLSAAWRHRSALERLYGAQPIDVRLGTEPRRHTASEDPVAARLEEGLHAAYLRAFPLIFGGKPRPAEPLTVKGTPPSVVLVVVESLRADAFTAERMPKLFEWSRRGLVAKNHYAGSSYSEAGMFLLLYGRSALLYHSTLDASVPPEICEVAHRLRYECTYYSGHPKKWMRVEMFLNERVMDRFVHDDRGDWPDWDRTALANATAATSATGRRPALAVVRLMSSHFEYQYPKEFELHAPVVHGAKWHVTNLTALGDDARRPLTNRYLNSVAFTDDAIADAVASLNPATSIVVVTGDHGESLYDDGHYGHGYSFADVIGRVPLVMVGPGIPEGTTLDALTLHVDLLPTIVHAVTGHDGSAIRSHGRSMLGAHPRREGTLFAHCSFSRDVADALLMHDGVRVRLELGLRAPEVLLRGFEDALGRAVTPPQLSPARIDGLVRAFEKELDVVRR